MNTGNLNQDRLYVFDCGVADKLLMSLYGKITLMNAKGGFLGNYQRNIGVQWFNFLSMI